MIPQADGEVPVVRIFPESTPVNMIPTMNDPDAYLLVDAGQTKDSCDCSYSIKAKLIINASPDSRHWGENEFVKKRDDDGHDGGVLLYARPYELSELLLVVPKLNTCMTRHKIIDDYYHFGGSLRHYMSSESKQSAFKAQQESECKNLGEEVCTGIVEGSFRVDFSREGPSGAVLSLEPKSDALLNIPRALVQSDFVFDSIAARVENILWTKSKAEETDGWKAMEKLLRLQLLKPEKCRYTVRRCVGRSDDAYDNKEYVELGTCQGEMRVVDMFKTIAEQQLEDNGQTKLLFTSYPFHPLFDMIYRKGDHTYHAFTATISGSKKSKKNLPAKFGDYIKKLAEAVGLTKNPNHKIKLYYATSTNDFDTFVTSPVKPVVPTEFESQVEVYHCHVEKQRPNQ